MRDVCEKKKSATSHAERLSDQPTKKKVKKSGKREDSKNKINVIIVYYSCVPCRHVLSSRCERRQENMPAMLKLCEHKNTAEKKVKLCGIVKRSLSGYLSSKSL